MRREPTWAEMDEGAHALKRLVAPLPELRVIVAMGEHARKGLDRLPSEIWGFVRRLATLCPPA